MSYSTVIVEHENHVGIITLNRPEQFNTFSSEMAKELNQALVQLDNEKNIRVIIVNGAGKAFSTGIDLSEFSGKSLRQYREWVGLMEQMSHVIAYMKKPVIASDAALRQADANRASFTIIDVRLDRKDVSECLARLGAGLGKRTRGSE